ncbi:MAG: hypothetical protein ABJB16_13360, partial [Saprospiraceae bacterium]
ISIPPNMLAAAPITIPLWYFDEKQDMWKEEGHADKIGNEYVGKVGHFSFWNCDDRFPAINWDISLIYKNGKPASGLNTSLTIKKSNSKVDGASNEAGLIKTIVPANEILIMEINDQCGNSIYSKEIGPYANDHSEGIITLPETSQVTTITGSAFDCNNNPVTKGFLRVNADGLNYVFNLEAQDGLFEESFLSCVDGDLTVRVIDETRTMSSLPLSFPSLPSLSVGNITVCDSLDQYIRFRVNGFNKEYIFRDLIAVVDENPQDDAIYIFAYDTIGYRGGFNFYLNGHSEGTYHNKATGVRVNLPNGEYGNVVNLNTTVTYLGKVEDFIEGTFDGQITAGNNGAGGNGNSDFSGSFVVKRSK